MNHDHFWNHAPKGMGETPENCPICIQRIEALEKRMSMSPWQSVALSVTAMVIGTYLVERWIKRK